MNNMNLSNSSYSNSLDNNNSLVFIDSNLDDNQSFVAAVSGRENTEVILLDSTRDGVEQITETVVNYSDLDSIHIVSHGQTGTLQLGSTNLHTGNLDDYSAELQAWSNSLNDEADILLYGCEIGSTPEGVDFLEGFGQLTKADIAASDDLTGSIELGGDWELEVATGQIHADSIYSTDFDAYDSILAIANEFYPSNSDNSASEPVIDFDFFGDTRELAFNGDAFNHNGTLRLTSAANRQKGSVFHQTAKEIDADTSFSTQFQFQITGGAKGADGFTFMLQNDSNGSSAVGRRGGGLGYRNIENSLAIEFDSYRNVQWESNDNHISILRDGNVNAALATTAAPVDLNSGSILNAWIDYNGQNDLLEVYLGETLNKPDAALLSLNIDLAEIGDRAYLGFSSGTGGRVNNHDILAWKVDWNPDLSSSEGEQKLNTLVDLDNFANLDRLELNGSATQANNVLRLTSTDRRQAGTVFYDEPIQVNDETSFSTQFQFQITGGTRGAEGFTFMLQNDLFGDKSVGFAGKGLGYQGIQQSVAIEFDTYQGRGELSNNHLSILSNGNVNNVLATNNAEFDLNSGQVLEAWIDYDGSSDLLEVFLSNTDIKPETAALSATIDLAATVGDRARIGFSAATGGLNNNHDILNWSFDSSDKLAPEGNFSNPIDWPSIAIHAGLTPDGKVLTYGLDSNINSGSQVNTKFTIWDPTLGTADLAFTVLDMTHPVDNAFCSGMLLLPDGQMLIAGGSIQGDRDAGNDLVHLYNYRTGEVTMLSEEDDLLAARWYPTLTTLTDGSILLQGGRNAGKEDGVFTPEIYTAGQGSTWLNGATSSEIYSNEDTRWWYPRSWVAPNGKVFGITGDKMYYLDPTDNGSIETVGTFTGENQGETSTAVMYGEGKILQIGGRGNNEATIIDINGETPVLSSAGTTNYVRMWGDSTVLPDGTVFVSGGSAAYNREVNVAYSAEIWDPKTNTWTVVDSSATPRLYHSTSLLLPDGRVLTGGGTTEGLNEEALTNEIYTPAYLFNDDGNLADRPTIESEEKLIDWNQSITAKVSSGNKIERISLVSFGAVTHSFDMGQRFLELDFTQSGNELTINTPKSANIAPPGFYMMFAIDENGVPSEAQIFQIAPEGVRVEEVLVRGTMDRSAHDGMHMGDMAHNGMHMNHNADCTEC